MQTKAAYVGAHKSIELYVEPDGSCPVETFLDALSSSDRRKVDALFEKMGEHGRISNEQKFKKLEGSKEIWEFKSFQIRLLCFHVPGKRLIVCRGVVKKRDKHTASDIGFAEGCRKKFQESS